MAHGDCGSVGCGVLRHLSQLRNEAADAGPANPSLDELELERYDCEYKRNGTVNLFIVLDVHRSWRRVKVTDSCAAVDFAARMRELCDVHFPKAERISRKRNASALSWTICHTLGRRALPGLSGRRSAPHAAPA